MVLMNIRPVELPGWITKKPQYLLNFYDKKNLEGEIFGIISSPQKDENYPYKIFVTLKKRKRNYSESEVYSQTLSLKVVDKWKVVRYSLEDIIPDVGKSDISCDVIKDLYEIFFVPYFRIVNNVLGNEKYYLEFNNNCIIVKLNSNKKEVR